MAAPDESSSEPRPFFMEPLPVVMTTISPIRAPSPCEECQGGIKRSGSCHDCLNQNTPHPPTPVATADIEFACRAYAGDDAVDTLLNPVGMALEYAATNESIARLRAIGEALQKREEHFCISGCGRMITEGQSCRPCDERQEAIQREEELLWSLLEEHCPGCGREGYDEYCSRDCLRECAQ